MKAIITLGASASGKSTWTRELIAQESQAGRVWRELNKDDTRTQMILESGASAAEVPAALKAWDYTPGGPAEIAMKKRLADQLALAVADGAHGVVFSNTNIDGGVGALAEITKHCPQGTRPEFKLFPTAFDVCLSRDAARALSVGEKVLRMQFEKLAALNLGFPAAPEPTPNPLVEKRPGL